METGDNAAHNISLPLRNLLQSVKCVTARVRDGESNESDGDFDLSNFWDTLNQAVKAVSQEATKISLAFSKPPLPSQQDGEKLADSLLKSVLSLATVYYWLPKSRGVSLRRHVRDATVEVLEGVTQLLEVILTSPLQSLSQEQLTSTGGVWSACDRFSHLPKDNKAAVLLLLSGQSGIVKDAIEELEQALSETHDPFGDVLDNEEDGDEPRGNRDTYWSERDRRVVAACRGLMKAAAACLKKMTTAVRAHGDARVPHLVEQLDDLVDGSMEISPGVDDLALCLYPPVDYNGVENNVSKLAALLKKLLAIIRSNHICGEAESSWVQFLDGAVDHNLQKAKDLIQGNG
ncbi:cyclin-D1-binding protein 1 homolog [Corythoichthys intestinalis]|uniref:cyclin-D1-binding protein 1 homolog n=1 Tax=Corythoichthys intestinalis TaxID=161448 RepID=UPI0025A58859|nr:cyclin-D1-binding protein 1 homolog [Corythoichthys intestinalis]XP_061814597.1 cyclin-D1-binding protein 1 homolog [Nerophis lumbriciformis]